MRRVEAWVSFVFKSSELLVWLEPWVGQKCVQLTSSGIRIYFCIEARFQLPTVLSSPLGSSKDFPPSLTPTQGRPVQEGKLPLGNCDLLYKDIEAGEATGFVLPAEDFLSSFSIQRWDTEASEEYMGIETSQWINTVKTLWLYFDLKKLLPR